MSDQAVAEPKDQGREIVFAFEIDFLYQGGWLEGTIGLVYLDV